MAQPRCYPDHAARQRAYRARQAQARREELQAKGVPAPASIATLPSRPRWQALIAHAQQALTTVHQEVQTYYDARSATWQEGDRAALLMDYREALEHLLDDLDTLPPL